MKKFVVFTLAALFALSLTACDGSDGGSDKPADEPAAEPAGLSEMGVADYDNKGVGMRRQSNHGRERVEIKLIGELIFDAINIKGLECVNKYVKKTGNASALMRYAIDDTVRNGISLG